MRPTSFVISNMRPGWIVFIYLLYAALQSVAMILLHSGF